jgi:hypothetical protein
MKSLEQKNHQYVLPYHSAEAMARIRKDLPEVVLEALRRQNWDRRIDGDIPTQPDNTEQQIHSKRKRASIKATLAVAAIGLLAFGSGVSNDSSNNEIPQAPVAGTSEPTNQLMPAEYYLATPVSSQEKTVFQNKSHNKVEGRGGLIFLNK